MVKLRLFGILQFLLVGLVLSSFLQEKTPLKYMQVATIDSSGLAGASSVTSFKDTLTNDLIHLRSSKENIPLYYFKEVKGEVCFDEECRLLDMVVYWNITGRYLGFELPKGEFLSKHDHEPFSESEYQRLHTLLADSSIPLDAVSFEKLVEPKSADGTVDAVSGATSKTVADMVVKGAAFTTYRLWNIVNGPTMDIISDFTEKQLTPGLIDRILQSPDSNDRLWALHRIDHTIALTPGLETSLLEIISSEDFYLCYSAIKAIAPVHLKNTVLQEHLFSMYTNANHSIQKELVKKLAEASLLSSHVLKGSRELLPQLNGQQLSDWLALYVQHEIEDLETCRAVVTILENENRYISKKAYDFLMRVQPNDAIIGARLETYKKEKM